jgi:anti-sigma B factor antagonist
VPDSPTSAAEEFRCQRYHLTEGVALVAAAGDIDLETAPLFRTVLLAAVTPEVPELVIDLTQVTLLDSTGIAALVAGWHRAEEFGGTVHVAGVSASIRTVFELTSLDDLLTLHPSVSDAVAAITKRPATREDHGETLGSIQALGDPASAG